MNEYEMVVTIVAMISFAGIVISFLTSRQQRASGPDQGALLEEMRAMKDRLATLERLAVDREHSLSREIDGLRNIEPIGMPAGRPRGVKVP